ncbi:splicing factor, suppressor of white-apricot homolog isoform X2 [Ptychodera flava]|uniref:splicing factor, suppressor of white-apricot homolog isoform X2 n=1 Tax=Ptychodera flava TaxID=63121 RepID=UPI00396AACF5
MALFGKKIKQKRAQIVDRKQVETARTREEELDELFVFGYAAKLFHDDEKAIYIDKGKHLIPWMGDESLMIDRYDGRGHLHDLSEYDLDAWNREYQLSEEEARIEALCDEERYLALHTDLLEEQHRQEEELKRLNEAIAGSEDSYTAVGFSYDSLPSSSHNDSYDPTQPTDDYEDDANKENQEEEENPAIDEEPFIAPKELEIPSDMEVPATVKTNAIIERTAIFVKTNGPQFEIILKAKQSGNSQFGFLDFDHYLNKYYRHVLKYIKSGKYVPKTATSTAPDEKDNNHRKASNDDESSCHTDDEEESDADSSGYLHPSLLTSRKTKSPKKTDAPPWPSGNPLPTQTLIPAAGASSALVGPVFGPMLPGIPILPAAASTTTNSGTTTAAILPPPLPPFMGVVADGSTVAPPPPHTVPPTTVDVNTLSSFTVSQSALSGITALTAAPPPPPPEDITSAVSTTSASAPAIPAIVPPPPDLQPVIDKMAKYVAKNGIEFEATVRAKSDPRFEFLLPWHSYHAYYEYKKKLFIEELDKEKEQDAETLPKKSRGPVSFSIKTKETEERMAESKSTFPVESSSSDSEGDSSAEKSDEKYNPFTLPEITTAERQAEKRKPQLSLEELEARQAKQRLEDKLALAAREKLAQSSRERQLQLERKKKAAMFLSMLKSNTPDSAASAAATIMNTEEMPGSTASVTVETPVSLARTARSESPNLEDSAMKFLPHSRSLSPVKRRSKSPPRSYRKSYRFHSQARSRSKSPKKHRSRSRSKSPKRRRHLSPPPPGHRPHAGNDNNRSQSHREISPPTHHRSNRSYDRRSEELDAERTYSPSNVNEDLRAKVRAMLAASRQHPTS